MKHVLAYLYFTLNYLTIYTQLWKSKEILKLNVFCSSGGKQENNETKSVSGKKTVEYRSNKYITGMVIEGKIEKGKLSINDVSKDYIKILQYSSS